MKRIKPTGVEKKKKSCKCFHQGGVISKRNWRENIPRLAAIFPSSRTFAASRRHGKAPFIRVPSPTVGGKKAIFDFLSFGISSSPDVLSDIKVNLRVMANRLANLSKPGFFDSFDTDLRVCECASACVCVCVRALPVSRYRKDTVEGPLQFKQVARYNARSAASALWHVMTEGFSAASQSRYHAERRQASPPWRWPTDETRRSHPNPKPPPASATVCVFYFI